jgi:UTP--glucose-1-phosphate uridylyltransferase
MNSFNTESETARVRHKYESRVPFHTFEQSCYPRINQETLRPVPEKPDLHEGEWYPPGHGDIYISLKRSGLLDKFMKQGKEIIFVSNIDNLGATVDLSEKRHVMACFITFSCCIEILNYLLKNPCEFVMEVTDKTRSDVKGGTLIEYEGKVRLLEIAQVPKDKIDEFKSISKFKVFNTNNLWMKMSSINDLLGKNEISMELIMNKKVSLSNQCCYGDDDDMLYVITDNIFWAQRHTAGNSSRSRH